MELSERMQKTVPGQVTWANPELGKKCSDCKWRVKHKRPKLSHGFKDQCELVFVRSGRQGEPFNAEKTIACSLFSE